MAKFTIDDYIDFGNNGFHDATTWQVSDREDFSNIIDESIHDTVNVKSWISPLPINGSATKFHADLDTVYCRVKIHIDDVTSDWFYIGREEVIVNGIVTGYTWNGIINQNDQPIRVTELDGTVSHYNSITDNFN